MGLISKVYRGLGTKITFSLPETIDPAVFDAAAQLVVNFEDRLTVNRDESEVMTVNHLAGIRPAKVSDATYRLIKRAVTVSRQALGFNVAIGPLVKLWKIGFDGANRPSDAAINERLALIDPFKIELDDEAQTVFLTQTGMEIDLGGIAKGFIADEIKALWQSMGVTTGIIDLGGNILLVGPSLHEDGLWRCGIQDPKKERHVPIGVLTTVAKSVGTSGIYERNLIVDGHAYHHMFDSKTGYPISNQLASVSIVSDRSIDGEVWSTIAFYQGLDRGMTMIEQAPGIEAVFVTQNMDVFTTSGITHDFIKTTDTV